MTSIEVHDLADHPDWVALVTTWHWREWGHHSPGTDEAYWLPRIAAKAQRTGIPFVLVAVVEGRPVGTLNVCHEDLDEEYGDRGPWLSGVVVQGEARDLGVGRRLLDAAERRAAAEGATELWLHTGEAQRFYERCGYTVVRPKSTIDVDAVLRKDLTAPAPDRCPTTLFVLCGLPGAGKTTLARQLEATTHAVRLSPDEWMDALAIDLYDEAARGRIERLQWDLAQQLLDRGTSVVVEWGAWSRHERDTLRHAARAKGVRVELRYLDVPLDVLWERVQSRNREVPPIDRASLERWSTWIEPPSADELALFDEPRHSGE